jgi:hypothetical protein
MRIKRLARPLSRLFGPGGEDSRADRNPVAGTDTVPQPRLADAALESGDETRRAADVGKLTDGERLRVVAGLSASTPSGVSAALERAAQERLAQLVDQGTLEFESLRASSVNLSALLAVAGYSNDPERLPRALAALDAAERRALVLGGIEPHPPASGAVALGSPRAPAALETAAG